MKKFALIALVLTVGVTCAFAASLKVPWFVDNAPPAAGIPPTSGTTTLVYLSNNTNSQVVCSIRYFSAGGADLGPNTNNTFSIDPNATVAFRPVANDPSTANGGQENPASGNLVPDRPRDVDTAKNGSLVVTFPGVNGTLGGQVTAYSSLGFASAHALVP